MTTRCSCLLLAVVALACASLFAACRRCPCPSDGGGDAAKGAAPASGTFAQQAERGSGIYAAACAKCHGADGRGGKAPALVGAGALRGTPPAGRTLRTVPFWTVGDVQRFVKTNMPPMGTRLSDADAWAVVAFALQANGVTPPAPLSAANGDTLPLGR